MKQALIYSLKVWLTCCFLGPTILLVLKLCTDKELFNSNYVVFAIGFIHLVGAYSLMFIVPCLSLLIAFNKVMKSDVSRERKKLYLLLVTETIISVWAILGSLKKQHLVMGDLLFWLSLSIPLLICIWFYKLSSKASNALTDTLKV